ncbi:helix-turn-helix domain-containing protein [Schleiferilactobacillus harbinensis]|uniref:helix-turn-helix domain-containing protein n=1 Tax=Schleiferilactobacillus harbinensis TaxID=304207 RepID=UPI00345E7BC3
MQLGQRFKKLRRERHITLVQAAGTDCSPSALSKFENGKSQLSAEVFISIITRLHIDWAEFRPTHGPQQTLFIQHYHEAVENHNICQLMTLRAALRELDPQLQRYRTEYYIVELTLGQEAPNLIVVAQSLVTAALDYLVQIDYWNNAAFILAALLVTRVPVAVLDAMTTQVMYQRKLANLPAEKIARADDLLVDIALQRARLGDLTGARLTLAEYQPPVIPDLVAAAHYRFVDCYIRQQTGDQQAGGEVQQLLGFLTMINAGATAKRWRQQIAPIKKTPPQLE